MNGARLGLFVVAAICGLPQAQAGETDDPTSAALLAAHNRERKKEGRPPLALSAKLCAAAWAHAKDMAVHQKQDHTGSDGSKVADRVKRTGYVYVRRRREHRLGPGYRRRSDGHLDAEPGHRENLLADFTEMVAARVDDAGRRSLLVRRFRHADAEAQAGRGGRGRGQTAQPRPTDRPQAGVQGRNKTRTSRHGRERCDGG